MPLALKDACALTFDCYGTLIDWERGILEALRPWVRFQKLDLTNAQLLEEFGKAESRIEQHRPGLPYTKILERVHHALARAFKVPEEADSAARFAASVGDWPPFDDTIDALTVLQKQYRLVIVSNTDRASFTGSQRQLGIEFDAVVMAEQVGAYKPDHRMFHRAFEVLNDLGVSRDNLIHVAQSLYHDHVPAKALGLTSVWVNRYGDNSGTGATIPPGIDVKPDYVVRTLRELVELIGV